MKLLEHFLGVLCAFCLMIIFLITSVEAVAYWTPGYYEHEYSKYNVTEAVRMEMDDLLEVTDEMMAYLRGDREDLHVKTTMGGQEREFFNEREIAHMEDVQVLFLKAMSIRTVCLVLTVLLLAFMAATKARMRKVLPSSLCLGTGLFFGLVTALGLMISTDFSRYFIMFHHIFFTNDLWILDPSTDMLINIVPEGFFMDTAARIALLFGSLSLILFGICLFLTIKNQKKAA